MVNEKDSRRIAFKFKVKQEYDVVIYYENGISAENLEDAEDALLDDILDLAYGEDGLVVRTNEETESSNGFIALVTTFDPLVEEIYNVKEVPAVIKRELLKRGLVENDK